MRLARFAVPLLAALLLGAVLYAGQTTDQTSSGMPPAVSDPQAIALLQRATAAMGVANDVTLTGTAEWIAGLDDETGAATLKAMASGQSRVDLSLSSGNRSEIRDPIEGSKVKPPSGASSIQVLLSMPTGGAWSGPDGVIHYIAFHNLMTDETWFFPAFTVENFAFEPDYVVSYIGTETKNEQAVVHIEVYKLLPALAGSKASPPSTQIASPVTLSKMDLFIDPATLLPVALDFNTHPDNNALLD